MSARILLVALVASLCGAAQAEPLHEFAHTLQGKVEAQLANRSADWGTAGVNDDLARLQAALVRVDSFLQGPAYTAADLHAVRQQLEAAQGRLHLSAAAVDNPSALQQIGSATERLAERFRLTEDNFDGKALPSLKHLGQEEMAKDPPAANLQSPQDLLRQAQSIRFDLDNLRGPFLAGRANAAGYDFDDDLRRLYSAADDYEFACRAPYTQVSETQRSYLRVASAFDRLETYSLLHSNSYFRNIEKTLDRLRVFYASVM